MNLVHAKDDYLSGRVPYLVVFWPLLHTFCLLSGLTLGSFGCLRIILKLRGTVSGTQFQVSRETRGLRLLFCVAMSLICRLPTAIGSLFGALGVQMVPTGSNTEVYHFRPF